MSPTERGYRDYMRLGLQAKNPFGNDVASADRIAWERGRSKAEKEAPTQHKESPDV